jgi:hypothetical protein
MHDSRGAALKVGDRVLIEAEITELSTGGDENYCCVGIKVVTPEQPGKDKVMSPPTFSALSTKMLTKVGAALALLLCIASDALAQSRCGSGGCGSTSMMMSAGSSYMMMPTTTTYALPQGVTSYTLRGVAFDLFDDGQFHRRAATPAKSVSTTNSHASSSNGWGAEEGSTLQNASNAEIVSMVRQNQADIAAIRTDVENLKSMFTKQQADIAANMTAIRSELAFLRQAKAP